MATKGRVNYRDSGNGQYIPKKIAERRDPKTWEKEQVKTSPVRKK
ncbi:hypothetical protein [Methylobacillus caricis]|nr:hypothetical protein [Methylobacillus caricis]